MPTTFFEKRRTILFLHWSVVLLTAAILYFGDRDPGFTLNNGIVLLLLSGHAAWSFFRPIRFGDRSLVYLLVLTDIGGTCLATWLSGMPSSGFYGLLFVSLIIAATVRGLGLLIGLSVGLAVIYPAIVWLADSPLEGVHWFTALLLGDCSFFFGYLAQIQRAAKLKAGSIYTERLFEFGRKLSEPLDLEELPTEIVGSIAMTMGVDACEVALIEDDKLVKRILYRRHCREFVDLDVKQSIHERAIANPGVIYSSTELQEDPLFTSKKDFSRFSFRTYMAKAWVEKDKAIGLIAVYTDKKRPWTEHNKQQFQFLVDYSFLAFQNAKLRCQLEAQARHDGLTGLFNHRHFHERLEEAFEQNKRKNHPLSVAIIDVDHFKRLNDSAGHRVGDQVLQALSTLLGSSVRRGDLVGRLGGDEFAIALPETTNENAVLLCRRILEAAHRLKVGQMNGFSLSIGCATFPADGETLAELIEHADQALYHSKHLGRGRVSRYAEVPAAR